MAPSLVGYTTLALPDATPAAISLPTGVADGDLLVLFLVGYNNEPTVSWTPRWNRVDIYTSDYICVYARVAASESSTYTVTPGGPDGSVAMMVALRDVAFGDLAWAKGATGPSALGVDGGLVLSMFGSVNDSDTYTGVTGLTAIGTVNQGTAAHAVVAYGALSSDGQTGTYAYAATGDMSWQAAYTLTFIPVPGPRFIGVEFGETASSAAFNINVPHGVQDGDLLVLATAERNQDLNDPSGWTKVIEEDASTNEWNHVYIRRASSEPAYYTVTPAGSGYCAALLIAFRHVGALQATTWVKGSPEEIPSVAGTSGGMLLGIACAAAEPASLYRFTGTFYAGYTKQGSGAVPILGGWVRLASTGATATHALEASSGISYDGYSALAFYPAICPTGIASAEAFGSPTVVGPVSLAGAAARQMFYQRLRRAT